MIWAVLSRSTDLLALIGLGTVIVLSVRVALRLSRLFARRSPPRA
ncbi:hypothetical protein [Methylobacterium nodulans]|uniref:Uncharacterized protein n=1 Tax=Methylobacterium nodulans (strain LMG 21967 / CNCM I-2342 / ORS 2060) TaxID=460265 RepID=B8IA51_METNO|nr:hypothetical protein [Methylobacterium nodulans]ACL59114.1 hypothetical protein Mnod_4238 [Methylobacterium nodulans ORS 2060]